MHIINIGSTVSQTITVDSMEITVDNMFITVDTLDEITLGNYTLDILPREFVNTVKMSMWGELDEISNEFIITPTITSRGLMRLSITSDLIVEGTSFNVTVNDMTDKLLWRGKVYCTSQTNLQEFKMNVPSGSNNIIKF